MKHKSMPPISKFMTSMPHTIGKDIPVSKALEMMREHRIRHLPVQSEGRLVGVLSDRDIRTASAFQGAGDLTVEDVMTQDPYAVRPEAAVNEVVSEMAAHKYGCAIVRQDNGKVVGIFTDNDGLRYLADVLEKNYTSQSA